MYQVYRGCCTLTYTKFIGVVVCTKFIGFGTYTKFCCTLTCTKFIGVVVCHDLMVVDMYQVYRGCCTLGVVVL